MSFRVFLPDGSPRTFDHPVTGAELAAAIGPRLAKDAVGVAIGGVAQDLNAALPAEAKVEILTVKSPLGLEILRHSSAHLLAHAVKELFPDAKIGIGPVTEDGFYYDLDLPKPLLPEDLPKLEARMIEIAARKLPVQRKELPRDTAIAFFKKLGEDYKVQIVEAVAPSEKITVYEQGSFTDLCRGPHVPNTEHLRVFKLTSIAGAYWRGDEKNKMLQRVYGMVFATTQELNEHLERLEEAKRRDHRRLGPELGLFTFLPQAPAMPFYLPKGTLLFQRLVEILQQELRHEGYEEVICPQLLATDVWKTSGHLENFSENMFFVGSNDPKEKAEMCLKPMNCPGHVLLYASTRRSYRELPIRYAEFTRVHRNERAGVTHGMMRVRNFAIDDGHIFCTEGHVASEAKKLVQQILRVYRGFGFEDIQVKLATRPPKSLGTQEVWDRATESLSKTLQACGHPFTLVEGEGAFYGPKIEFHIRDSLRRLWQCGTVQLDFMLPERFGLEYVAAENQMQRPVMIHRAIFGSLERFIAILIEHYGGHFPLWLSPVQVSVLSVNEAQAPAAEQLAQDLKQRGFRVHTDARNEKLGYKIREAQVQRVPLMVILGPKEVEQKTVSIRRSRGGQTEEGLSMERLLSLLQSENTFQSGGLTH